MGAKLNIKRLAISAGILGLVVVPCATGSLLRFGKHPTYSAELVGTYDAEEDCLFDPACERERIGSVVHPATLDADRAFEVIRDAVIGGLSFAAFALLLPGALRRYWRWLTT